MNYRMINNYMQHYYNYNLQNVCNSFLFQLLYLAELLYFIKIYILFLLII